MSFNCNTYTPVLLFLLCEMYDIEYRQAVENKTQVPESPWKVALRLAGTTPGVDDCAFVKSKMSLGVLSSLLEPLNRLFS